MSMKARLGLEKILLLTLGILILSSMSLITLNAGAESNPKAISIIIKCQLTGIHESPQPCTPKDIHVGTTIVLSSTCDHCSLSQPLSYSWTLVQLPLGSADILSNPTSATPSFVPDVQGNYQIRLVVSDSLGHSSVPSFLTFSTSSCGTCTTTISPTISQNPSSVGSLCNSNNQCQSGVCSSNKCIINPSTTIQSTIVSPTITAPSTITV